MRTLQIARRFVTHDWGGTETVVLETARRLVERGHSVEIATSAALSQAGCDRVQGIDVHRHPYFYPYLGLGETAKRALDLKGGNMFSFSLLKDLYQRRDLDLIHCHTGKRFGAIGRCAARRLDIPYVVTLHGGFFDVPSAEGKRLLSPTEGTLEWGKILGWSVGSRRLLSDADAILCVGQEECRRVRERLPGSRVEWLPNGVDSSRFSDGDGRAFRAGHQIPGRRRVLLCVGRIDPQKNQLFLLRLLRERVRQGNDDHLLLIGHVTDPSYRDRVCDEIRALQLHDRVTLIEGIPAASQVLVDAYHAADWFLLPSLHEPFGVVLLEAWAAGLPVVANRIGGVPSFVEHRRDGLLLDSGDLGAWVSALADCGSQGRQALAAEGRRKARTEFDWSAVTKRLEATYLELIEDRKSGRRVA